MGILTDPSLSRRNQLGRNLIKHKRKICICLYIASLAWFCCLGLNDYNHSTYLSENALSPGLAYTEIRYNSAKHARTLLEELQVQRQIHKDEIPYAWLQAKMKQIGLEVYTHNFTLNYPFGGGQKFTGKNIYGILRAPRIGSTEGIVYSTPYRSLNSLPSDTTASIAALLAFAEFATTKSYWAKDLIFLITDQEQLGMQAWLKAYHHSTHGDNSILNAGNLKGRSGSLQAALNFEIESLESDFIDVKIEGLNGQLPNLDMFNLVQRLALRENLYSSNQLNNKKRRSDSGTFQDNIINMLSMIITQANGVPTGNHGLYLPYRIEALTITGNKFGNSNYKNKEVNTQVILKIIESTSRSLNNLLERFHQSFFFYILVTDNRFVSIGDYMPCLGLMVAALLIKAFLTWLNISGNDENDENLETNSNIKKTNKKVITNVPEINLSFKEVGYIFILSYLISFMAYYLPQNNILSEIAFKNGISTENFIGFVLTLIAFIGIMIPTFKEIKDFRQAELLHIVALLHLASTLIVIGLLNFSIGFLLAILSTPFAIVLDINNHRILKSFSMLYLLLLHPLTVVYSIVSVLTFRNFPELSVTENLIKSIKATFDAIVFSVVDLIVYGNWLFKAATLLFLSSWILFWCLLCTMKSKSIIKKVKTN